MDTMDGAFIDSQRLTEDKVRREILDTFKDYKRVAVFGLINDEREYQDAKPENSKDVDRKTSVAAWLLYIHKHLHLGEDSVYNLDEQTALEEIRKIASLAVACMEYNETPNRVIKDKE